jgi:selenium metabolism protein YedF
MNMSQQEKGDWTVAISCDRMGEGAEDLGRILIKSYVASLPQLENPPAVLILFNAGVLLAIEGATTVPALKELEAKGTKILACGTCLDFFDSTEKLQVGSVSNMLEISSKMASAAHLVNI